MTRCETTRSILAHCGIAADNLDQTLFVRVRDSAHPTASGAAAATWSKDLDKLEQLIRVRCTLLYKTPSDSYPRACECVKEGLEQRLNESVRLINEGNLNVQLAKHLVCAKYCFLLRGTEGKIGHVPELTDDEGDTHPTDEIFHFLLVKLDWNPSHWL